MQPQLLPRLFAEVLEQEESQARVSVLPEEVLPDGAHGQLGPEERGRHLPEGAGEHVGLSLDRRRRDGGRERGRRGQVCDARGGVQALLPGRL